MSLVVTRAPSLPKALQHLAEAEERPTILAGGTDLMVLVNARSIAPKAVLDIHGLNVLRAIRVVDGRLHVGALASYRDIIRSKHVQSLAPALVEASRTVGAVQIQARGTLGGNVANASPAGDTLPVLAAQGCDVVLGSTRGERTVRFNDLFLGYRRLDMRDDELLVRFELDPLPEGAVSTFRKVGTRLAQAISKVMLAGVGVRAADGTVASLRLAVGSVAPVPLRLRAAETAALGLPIEEAAEASSSAAREAVTPIDDVRSSADYRREVTGRLVARFVRSLG